MKVTATRAPLSVRKRTRGGRAVARACATIQPLEPRVFLSAAAPTVQVQSAVNPGIALSTTTWTPVGPAPLSNGSAGRITGLAADPANPNIIYAAAAGGGVWKTVDGGAAWLPLTDAQSTLFTGAVAVAPSNTSVIYAGTGEANGSALSYYGRGVLKSTDGGTTWTLTGNSVFDRKSISQIVVDPANPSIAYAAVTANGVNGVTTGTGIYKTVDGGTTWNNTTGAVSTTAPFNDLDIDPTNGQRLYCAVGGGVAASGVYVSTNGGTSWALVGGGLTSGTGVGSARIAMAPSNTQVLYTSLAATNGNLLSFWTSTNGGGAWTQLSATPNYLGGQAAYDSTLIVDPRNPNVVYAGGASGGNSFIETSNGGLGWTDISTANVGTSPHARHHGIAFDANGRLLDGNDGGVWRLDNPAPGSVVWTPINGNLQNNEVLGVTLDPTTSGNAFAASQDNGVAQYGGNTIWTVRDGGDGGIVRLNAQAPNQVFRQVPSASIGGNNNFFRVSNDGGATWSSQITGISTADPQNTYAPLTQDPSNGAHLFYGTNRVYETTVTAAGVASWTAISATNSPGWTTTANINAIGYSPANTSTVYANAGGHIYVTTDHGATWNAKDPATAGVASAVSSILVDPASASTAYLTTTAFGLAHVYKTIDGGTTWNAFATGLPDLATYSIAYNAAQTALYVGNDNGVYVSTNGGTSWAPMGVGLPNVQVRDLAFSSALNVLAAGTLGRGVFEISTAPATQIVVNTATDDTTAANGLLSLREAVAQANTAGGGAIVFDPALTGSTLQLSAVNGAVVITAPTLSITGPAVGGLSLNTVAGAPLEIGTGTNIDITNLSIGGASTVLQVDVTGQLILHNSAVNGSVNLSGALNIAPLSPMTLNATFAGSGTLTKSGTAPLTLIGLNSYAGGTTVAGGTLIGNTNAIHGGVAVAYGAAVAFDQSALPGANGTFSGIVSGAGTLRVLGPASTLTLANTATLTNTGPTVIDPGASIVAASANDLSATSTHFVNGALNLGGFGQSIGTLDGGASGLVYNVSTQATLTATLVVGGSNAHSAFAGLLENVPVGSPNGGILAVRKNGSGFLTLSNVNTFTGGLTLAAGTLVVNNNKAVSTGTVTITGGTIDTSLFAPMSFANNNPQSWGGNFTIGNSANFNLGTGAVTLTTNSTVNVPTNTVTAGGVISGAFTLGKSGLGTLALTGANSYSAGTSVNGGVLAGNTTSLQGVITDNAVLTFDQSLGGVSDGTFTGSVTGFGAINVRNGTVRLASSTLLRNFGQTTVNAGGTLVGPASGGVNALSNISTYQVDGTLDLGASSQTIASLSGAGTVYHFQPVGQPAPATLTLGGDDSSTFFAGVLRDTAPASGNGGVLAINKVGAGTLTLSGANTLTGGLTVAAGAIAAGPAPAAADPLGGGGVTLNGGSLALNGRVGTPVQQVIGLTGWNQDVIVEANAASALAATTAAVDSATSPNGYVWYEKNFGGATTSGLPLGGGTFVSAANPAVSFLLQPYNGFNVAYPAGVGASVTLALTSPAAFATLNLLASAGSGNANLSAQFNFADGSAAFTQFAVNDWFNGAGAAFTTGGRVLRNTGAVNLLAGNPRLYEYDYTLPPAYQNKLLTSITFTQVSGAQVGVYAVSGGAAPVPGAQSYPNAVTVLAPASIDVEGSLTASLGNLSINASQLTLTGPAGASLAWGAVTMTGNATFNASAGTTLSLGAVGESGGARSLTKSGTGTLVLTTADSYTGGTTASAGTLIANVAGALPNNGPLSIGAAGTVQLKQSTPAFTTTIGTLSIGNGGKLDITNNTLFVNYGAPANDPIAAIRTYLQNAFAGGTWGGTTGARITSSTAAAGTPNLYTIGYADSADGTGVNATPTSIKLRYTVTGDTDLDGTVGLSDYTAVVRNFGTGTNWDQGAVTYGGTVNLSDYTAVVRNFGLAASPAAVPATATTSSTSSAAATPTTPQTPLPVADAGVSSSTTSNKHRGRWQRSRR